MEERVLMVGRIRLTFGQCDKRRRLLDVQGVITMDDSGAKLDRRDMPFPGGTQTKDKTEIART